MGIAFVNINYINVLKSAAKRIRVGGAIFDREQRSKVLKGALLLLFLAWWNKKCAREQNMFLWVKRSNGGSVILCGTLWYWIVGCGLIWPLVVIYCQSVYCLRGLVWSSCVASFFVILLLYIAFFAVTDSNSFVLVMFGFVDCKNLNTVEPLNSGKPGNIGKNTTIVEKFWLTKQSILRGSVHCIC